MEDINKKHPSIPANYVTLAQLQERWLKVKEEKEKEKQQQEEREEELRRKLADKKDSVGHRSRPNSYKSTNSKRRVWNHRDKPDALVSGVKVAVDGDKNADQEGKSVNSKKKKHQRLKNPKLEFEKEVTEKDGVAHALPENGDKEDIGWRRKEESGGVGVGLRAKGSNLDQTVEVETKIRDLSVNARTGKGNGELRRTSTFHNRGNWEFRGNGSWRFGRREVRKQEVTEKDGVAHALPENGDKEDIGWRRKEESRGVGGGLRAKGSNLDQTVEVETKIRDLSVNARIGRGNGELRRTSTFHNRGNWEFRGNGSWRFGRREVRKQRDSGMVWVKKGELFNGNAGTMQKSESSGSVSGLKM